MASSSKDRVQTQPELWQNLINASLDEGYIEDGLKQLQTLLVDDVVPSIQHIQLLVYLALHPVIVNPNANQKRLGTPSKEETESHQFQALQLLNQLLSTVKPAAIAGAFPNATNHRACISYQPHGKLQQVVQDFFNGHPEGIWGLVLTGENDCDDWGTRDVKPDAWEFLQWLVTWWEKDQADNGYSPLFLRQLPPGIKTSTSAGPSFSSQYDCELPLSVISAASKSAGLTETVKRRKIAKSILNLLYSATMTPKEMFSSSALRTALCNCLDRLQDDYDEVEAFLGWFRSLPWVFVADVLTTHLERREVNGEPSVDPLSVRSGPYTAPSPSKFFSILAAPQYQTIYKISLFTLLQPHLTWEQPSDATRQDILTTFAHDTSELALVEALLNTLSPPDIETERMLIESSLLPAESLSSEDGKLMISSEDSKFEVHVAVRGGYPAPGSATFEVRREGMGREEQIDWQDWVKERMEGWNEAVDTEYPIYHMLTEHFLPLLAPAEPEPEEPITRQVSTSDDTLHHVLFTSHHLIAPSKRKDLKSLSSSHNLRGFGKVGHPGIIFAEGRESDLDEFVREVKSWQWLALRLRVFEQSEGQVTPGRGQWTELEKIGEAVDWLRAIGKERLLLDIGMGSG